MLFKGHKQLFICILTLNCIISFTKIVMRFFVKIMPALLIMALIHTQGLCSANTWVNDSTNNPFKEEVMRTIGKMQVSMQGRTPQGNTYNLYAIKKGKDWTYLILDSSGYYSVKQVKGQEEVQENSQTYTDMVCMMAKAKMLKKKNRPKNVSGLTLSCYYKFRPKAATMYKQYTYVERKAKFINQNLKGGSKGILKILQMKL